MFDAGCVNTVVVAFADSDSQITARESTRVAEILLHGGAY